MIRRCIASLVVFFLLAGILPTYVDAASFDNWNFRSPLPSNDHLFGVTYVNDTFVAVGAAGTIVTSSDGVNWTHRTSGTRDELRDVTYGNGTFVAVGNRGTILTSSDATNWTNRSLDAWERLFHVTYGNGTFVAVGNGGMIVTSSDATNWTNRSSGTINTLISVTYGDGAFVAVGENGTILTSSDGTNWTSRTSGTTNDVIEVIYVNGTFVAVGGSGTILTSNDGTNWTNRSSGTTNSLNSVTYGNNTLMAVGESGTIVTSSDGTNWTNHSSGTTDSLYSVTYGNSTYVAVGYFGTTVTSSDGASWTRLTSGTTTTDFLFDVTYGNSTYVAVGNNGMVVTSSDGTNWTHRSSGTTNSLNRVTYGNGTFMAVGVSGTIVTSSDGTSWTNRSSGTTNNLSGVTYGNGTFVAVGQGGTIVASNDGTNWMSRTSGTTSYLSGVIYGNGTFVAVGTNGMIVTSSDGTNWTNHSSGTTDSLLSVTYGNGTFVAVGYMGAIVTSSDGANWTSRTSGTTYYIDSVTYGDGTFVAVSEFGTIVTSSDGVNWTSHTLGTWHGLRGVAYGNNSYVAVGNYGTIMQYTYATVTYNGNGSTGGSAPTDNDKYEQGVTVSVYGNTENLVKTGHTFSGWNTAADGSGTSYAAGDTFSMGSSNVTLYAQWRMNSYTVSYDGNGSTGGFVPTVVSQVYNTNITVSGNTGNLVHTGYTFAGWNTAADGSGTPYAAGATFPITADTTLYAQWLSSNAMLSNLIVSQGTIAFAPSNTNYTVDVPNPVTSLDIFLTKDDPSQTFTVTGAMQQTVTDNVYSYRASDLLVGANSIQILVTAKDGTQHSYHLTVNRAALSNNADLNGLTLSDGTLNPAFATSTTSYTASVPNSVSSLTVTASVYESNASLKVNGTQAASGLASGAINLNVGSNPITVEVTAQDGTTKSYIITVTRAAQSSSNDSSSDSSDGSGRTTAPTEQNKSTDLTVTINGKTVQSIATATASDQEGKIVLTATVDADKLAEQLASAGDKPVVTLPVTSSADKVTAVLTGDVIRALANKQATLDIQTPNGSYKLPASHELIAQLSMQLGAKENLSDVSIHVDIAKSDSAKVKLLENAANTGQFMVVVPPVDFGVTASYNDQSVTVDTFSSFVEREIPIPDGVDASKITTAVVLNEDGTTRSVPTHIITRDGIAYAVINSLTNSTYSLVSHSVAFNDVSNHWAKDAVNDMGSRMVMSGTGDGLFSPDREITRAEFAAIIVCGLGLKLRDGTSAFSDVKANAWYIRAMNTANAYHLINGYEDGTFRPNDKITREEAMVIIAKAMTITSLKAKLSAQSTDVTLRSYLDAAAASAWAQSSIADCVQSGVISGRSSTELAPKAFISRAEVAAIVQRLLQKSGLI